jgi:cytochrome b561
MSWRSDDHGYGSAARTLHWAAALLIPANLALGFAMGGAPDAERAGLMRAHVWLGSTLAVVLVLRILLRFVDRRPAPLSDLSPLHRWFVAAVAVVLYALPALTVASGLAGLSQLGAFDVFAGRERPVPPVESAPALGAHGALAVALLVFVLVHVAGVVLRHVSRHDVFGRMSPLGMSRLDTQNRNR